MELDLLQLKHLPNHQNFWSLPVQECSNFEPKLGVGLLSIHTRPYMPLPYLSLILFWKLLLIDWVYDQLIMLGISISYESNFSQLLHDCLQRYSKKVCFEKDSKR